MMQQKKIKNWEKKIEKKKKKEFLNKANNMKVK